MPMTKVTVSGAEPNTDKPWGNSLSMRAAVLTGPCIAMTAVVGTNKIAKNIIIP